MNIKNNSIVFDEKVKFNFVNPLLAWYAINKRPLVFREDTIPYKIWISEIMAQQTQIATLIPYYNRFISAFPTIKDLAEAKEDDVLKAWQGLGYYSRAKNLLKAAQLIVSEYDGIFPKTFHQILTLPGIGSYTAGAIASICFGETVPAIDGNVRRVVARFTNFSGDLSQSASLKSIEDWVYKTLPTCVGDYNQALMELGALICTPQNPCCDICPVSTHCLSRQKGKQTDLPIKTKKIKHTKTKMEMGLIFKNNRLFIEKRPNDGLLGTLWGFPILPKRNNSGEAIRQFVHTLTPNITKGTLIGKYKHVFSHITWEIEVYTFKIDNLTVSENTPLYGGDSEKTPHFETIDTIRAKFPLPVAFEKALTLVNCL